MGKQSTLLIIGAGHAGLEAAFAAARIGHGRGLRVRVITGQLDTVGQTLCNPSKGPTVRSIRVQVDKQIYGAFR